MDARLPLGDEPPPARRARRPQVLVFAASAIVVLVVGVIGSGRKAPGPLIAAHERVPELSGAQDCATCHGGFWDSMGDACLACHEMIGEQIDVGEGLHGTTDRASIQDCSQCHSEHHGEDFVAVNQRSFARAGVPDPEAFDHRRLGFPMDGQHLQIDCVDCHTHAREVVVPEGEVRFGGLEQDCASCHEDSHEGRMVLDCNKCHGQESFDQLIPSGHEEFLPLIGGHGSVACTECHAEESDHSLDVLGAATVEPTVRACVDCHELPHADTFVQSVATFVSSTAEASCRACHEDLHRGFDEGTFAVTPDLHACSGFPLDAPHDLASCEDCHAPDDDLYATAYPGREADACGECHDDPHGGQFVEGPFATPGCAACHDRQFFEPHAFTTEKHAQTRLPLTGRHEEIDCAQCHKVEIFGTPRPFHGTPDQCSSCHEDAHRGFFDAFAEDLDLVEHGSCAQCHEPTTFADEVNFDHGAWTEFEVDGAHAQTDCETCHPRAAEPDEFGRTFGWVDEHLGSFRECTSCHTDPHQGQFDRPEFPQSFDNNTGCARCHITSSFRSIPKTFEHRLWTGFPLTGVHQRIDCSSCHAALRVPTEQGRTWARARGTDCADCHTDNHAGQFLVDGATDCQRCHLAVSSFTETRFDHERDSRFSLGEAHEMLACSACHEPVQIGDEEVVRYRPIPMECVDCHGVHEDVLLRRMGANR